MQRSFSFKVVLLITFLLNISAVGMFSAEALQNYEVNKDGGDYDGIPGNEYTDLQDAINQAILAEIPNDDSMITITQEGKYDGPFVVPYSTPERSLSFTIQGAPGLDREKVILHNSKGKVAFGIAIPAVIASAFKVELASGELKFFNMPLHLQRLTLTSAELLDNSRMEGPYSGGLAPDWTKSGSISPFEAVYGQQAGDRPRDVLTGSSAQGFSGSTSEDEAIYTSINLNVGQRYTFSAWVKRTDGNGSINVKLKWQNPDDSVITSAYIPSTKDTYTKLTHTFIAPAPDPYAPTVKMTMKFYASDAATEGVFDDVYCDSKLIVGVLLRGVPEAPATHGMTDCVVRNIGHTVGVTGHSVLDLDNPEGTAGDDNHGHAIALYGGASPDIIDCDIRNNYDGVAVNDDCAPRLWSTGVAGVEDDPIFSQMKQRIRLNARFGIGIRNKGAPEIGKLDGSLLNANDIQANGYANIACQDSGTPKIYYNFIGGLFNWGYPGVESPGRYGIITKENSQATIIGNYISDHNLAGIAAKGNSKPLIGPDSLPQGCTSPQMITSEVCKNVNVIYFNNLYAALPPNFPNYVPCGYGEFENIDCAAVAAMNGAQPIIKHNFINQNGWVGVGARDGAAPTVQGNWISQNIIGVALMTVRNNPDINIKIGGSGSDEGNYIYKNERGIVANNSGSPVNRVLIKGNRIYDNKITGRNGGVGIGIKHSYALIKDNQIFTNGIPGRWMVGGITGGRGGIGVTHDSDVIITSNNISNNSGVAIGVRDSTVQIVGNLMIDNWGGTFYNTLRIDDVRDYIANGGFGVFDEGYTEYVPGKTVVAPNWEPKGSITASKTCKHPPPPAAPLPDCTTSEPNNVYDGYRAQKFGAGDPYANYIYQEVPVAQNQEYRFTGWLKKLSGTAAYIQLADPVHSDIYTTFACTTDNEWTEFTTIFSAESNVLLVKLYAASGSEGIADAFLMVKTSPGSTVTEIENNIIVGDYYNKFGTYGNTLIRIAGNSRVESLKNNILGRGRLGVEVVDSGSVYPGAVDGNWVYAWEKIGEDDDGPNDGYVLGGRLPGENTHYYGEYFGLGTAHHFLDPNHENTLVQDYAIDPASPIYSFTADGGCAGNCLGLPSGFNYPSPDYPYRIIYSSGIPVPVPDSAMPILAGLTPAEGDAWASDETEIVMYVQDLGDGILQNSLILSVNGENCTAAGCNGTPTPSTLTISPDESNASQYKLVFTPAVPLPGSVAVGLKAKDALENIFDNRFSNSWEFSTVTSDAIAPYVDNPIPSGSICVQQIDTNIQFELKDDGTGVDSSTISVTVQGDSGISSTLTPVPLVTNNQPDLQSYTFFYNPAANFNNDETVTWTVSAQDYETGALINDTRQFCTEPDNIPPLDASFFMADLIGEDAVELTWDPSPDSTLLNPDGDLDRYKLQVCFSELEPSPVCSVWVDWADNIAPAATSYNLVDIPSGQYKFMLISVDKAGNESFGVVANADARNPYGGWLVIYEGFFYDDYDGFSDNFDVDGQLDNWLRLGSANWSKAGGKLAASGNDGELLAHNFTASNFILETKVHIEDGVAAEAAYVLLRKTEGSDIGDSGYAAFINTASSRFGFYRLDVVDHPIVSQSFTPSPTDDYTLKITAIDSELTLDVNGASITYPGASDYSRGQIGIWQPDGVDFTVEFDSFAVKNWISRWESDWAGWNTKEGAFPGDFELIPTATDTELLATDVTTPPGFICTQDVRIESGGSEARLIFHKQKDPNPNVEWVNVGEGAYALYIRDHASEPDIELWRLSCNKDDCLTSITDQRIGSSSYNIEKGKLYRVKIVGTGGQYVVYLSQSNSGIYTYQQVIAAQDSTYSAGGIGVWAPGAIGTDVTYDNFNLGATAYFAWPYPGFGGTEITVDCSISSIDCSNSDKLSQWLQFQIDMAQPGDYLYFPCGAYDIGGNTIMLKEGVSLRGAGRDCTTIRGTGVNILIAADGSVLEGFTFDGVAQLNTGIYLSGFSAMVINNEITRCLDAIRIGGASTSYSVITMNNIHHNSRFGVVNTGMARTLISENRFWANSLNSIGNRDTSTAYIEDNFIGSSGLKEIIIKSNLGDQTGLPADQVRLGHDASDTDGEYNGKQLILLSGIGYPQTVSIDTYIGTPEKVCTVSPAYTVPPSEGDLYMITEAWVPGSGYMGIGNRDTSTARIRRNTITKSNANAIGLRGSTEVHVEDNDLFSNVLFGIGNLENAAGYLTGNRIYNNGEIGIAVRDEAKPTIINNKIWNNGNYGIGIRDLAEAAISYNRIFNNGEMPLKWEMGVGGNSGIGVRSLGAVTIENNEITSNASDGIEVNGIIMESSFGNQGGLSLSDVRLNSSASEENDFYNGMSLVLINGTGFPKLVTINDYLGSDRRAVVSPPFDLGKRPSSGDNYLISASTLVSIGGASGRPNVIHHNGRHGIGLLYSSPTISHQKIYENGKLFSISQGGASRKGDGIGVWGASSFAVIEHNQIWSNYEFGVGLTSGAQATLRYNEIFNNGMSAHGYDSGGDSGVGLYGAGKEVTLVNNRIYNNKNDGIELRGGDPEIKIGGDSWTYSNYIYNNGRHGIGIIANSFTTPTIKYNWIYNNGLDATIDLDPSVPEQRRGNGIGVYGSGATASLVIDNNKIRGNREFGVGIRNGAQATITNNDIYSNGREVKGIGSGGCSGIGVYAVASGIVIQSNRIYNNANDGVGIRNSTLTIDTANNIFSNGRHGIGVIAADGATSSVIIKSQLIYFNGKDADLDPDPEITLGGHGIGVYGSGASVTAENNQLWGNLGFGVGARDQAMLNLKNNDIYLNGTAAQPEGQGGHSGVGLYAADVNSVIESNRIFSNANDGLEIRDCSITIDGSATIPNQIYNNGRHGIGIFAADGVDISPIIKYNEIYNNGRDPNPDVIGNGIGIWGANVINAGIYNNKLRDNGDFGIGVRNGANVTIRDNDIYNNDDGIGLRVAGTSITIEDNDIYTNLQSGISIWNCSPTIGSSGHPNNIRNNSRGVIIKGEVEEPTDPATDPITPTIQFNLITYNKTGGIDVSGEDPKIPNWPSIIENQITNTGAVEERSGVIPAQTVVWANSTLGVQTRLVREDNLGDQTGLPNNKVKLDSGATSDYRWMTLIFDQTIVSVSPLRNRIISYDTATQVAEVGEVYSLPPPTGALYRIELSGDQVRLNSGASSIGNYYQFMTLVFDTGIGSPKVSIIEDYNEVERVVTAAAATGMYDILPEANDSYQIKLSGNQVQLESSASSEDGAYNLMTFACNEAPGQCSDWSAWPEQNTIDNYDGDTNVITLAADYETLPLAGEGYKILRGSGAIAIKGAYAFPYIYKNEIYNSAAGGVKLRDKARAALERNHIWASGGVAGLAFRGEAEAIIQNENLIGSNYTVGIKAGGAGAKYGGRGALAKVRIINNNRIYNNFQQAILVSHGSQVWVENDNDIFSNGIGFSPFGAGGGSKWHFIGRNKIHSGGKMFPNLSQYVHISIFNRNKIYDFCGIFAGGPYCGGRVTETTMVVDGYNEIYSFNNFAGMGRLGNLTISNGNKIHDFGHLTFLQQYGIHLEGSEFYNAAAVVQANFPTIGRYVTVRNNRFHHNLIGIRILDPDEYLTIEGNLFYSNICHNPPCGTSGAPSGSIEYEARYVGAAILLKDVKGNFKITNNNIYNNGMGIAIKKESVSSGRNSLVENNAIHDNNYSGLLISGAVPIVQGNRIFSNGLSVPADQPILSRTEDYILGHGISVQRGESDNCPGSGCLYYYADGVQINNNIIRNNKDYGIAAKDEKTYVSVNNNIIALNGDRNSESGIRVEYGEILWASNNIIYSNYEDGISMRGKSESRQVEVTIRGNDIYGNGWDKTLGTWSTVPDPYGVGVQDYSDVKIDGNNIYRNKEAGIGLNIDYGSKTPVIQNNFIFSNVNYGIKMNKLAAPDGAYLYNNTIVANRYGLYHSGNNSPFNQPDIVNTILWNNTKDFMGSTVPGTFNPTISYSDISSSSYPAYPGKDANNNFNDDPQFKNAASGDFHIYSSSHCKDEGTPEVAFITNLYTDYDRDPRDPVKSSGFDIGADETEGDAFIPQYNWTITIDNTEVTSFGSTGTWHPASTSGSCSPSWNCNYRTDYLYNDEVVDGSASATWTATIPEEGYWEVDTWWVASADGAGEVVGGMPREGYGAPYTINYTGGSVINEVSQRLGFNHQDYAGWYGGRWMATGQQCTYYALLRPSISATTQYFMEGATASVELSSTPNGKVAADAVRFQRIFDDDPSQPYNFSSASGPWLDATSTTDSCRTWSDPKVNPNQLNIGGSFLLAEEYAPNDPMFWNCGYGVGQTTISWEPIFPISGYYYIYNKNPLGPGSRYLPLNRPSTGTKFTIDSASGRKVMSVNQVSSSRSWRSLGRYYFDYGRSGRIKISNDSCAGCGPFGCTGRNHLTYTGAIKFIFDGK